MFLEYRPIGPGVKPLPKRVGGRKVLEPVVDFGLLFFDAARPKAVYKHSPAIGKGGTFVSSFNSDLHVRAAPNIQDQFPKLNFSESCTTEHNRHLRQIASIAFGLVLLVIIAGCEKDPALKTDAELGLNAQQAQGRRVFQVQCAICHSAYSSKPLKGPSMKGLYQKQYLPSGLVANDRFVEQTIVRGRNMMPPMGNAISQEQLDGLIAYLHTL